MRIRGVPLSALAEAGVRFGYHRLATRGGDFQKFIRETSGRSELSLEERRVALGSDAALRRLGVNCLWRAVVVTDMLRRRGVAARMNISVSQSNPRIAHAEVGVGGESLRIQGPDLVEFK